MPRLALAIAFAVAIIGCTDFNFSIPKGPVGDDGQTSYEVWKSEVESGAVSWPADKTGLSDYIVYCKGERGDDGQSVYELWKQLVSSGNVQDPHNPAVKWDPSKNSEADFWNFITGRDGKTPHVGTDGNWWIGSENTGIKAVGKDGADGAVGLDGLDGESAFELWKKLVAESKLEWPADKLTETDFYTYLKGKDAENGLVPHVGTDGFWYIGAECTYIPAKGETGDTGAAGADGSVPFVGADGHWWIGSTDTGIVAKGDTGDAGADGEVANVPYIGSDGHWWIGTTDTGVVAKGETGAAGADGAAVASPYVGADGYWWVGTSSTGIPAKGAKGDKGDAGADGADGSVPRIVDGYWWIGSTNTGIEAKGATGDTGATGAAGADGTDGKIPYVKDGTWWIGSTDTGKPATGDTGAAGASGADGTSGTVPHIGTDGYWYVGTTNTGVKAAGSDGASGLTAYELWVADVQAGNISDKLGNPWPATKITIEDFYLFLKGEDGAPGAPGAPGANGAPGADGASGSSAYEIWKTLAQSGNLDDPKNPGQKWPSSNVSVADFYYYLSGTEGAAGLNSSVNGLSAYELWKTELAARAGTADALWNYAEDVEWDPAKNTLDDFYIYLRGTDGANGKDGKPGLPGEPGAIVAIVKGSPNVIAQYSQSEFSEYVRTTDGGVLYKVYDKFGALAPGAVVKGLPGLDPGKTYTANSNGEFIIPKMDLPNIQDVESRWGKVTSVTIKGEESESSENTYVPNQPHMRIVLRSASSCSLSNYASLYFDIQRRMNPDDDWKNLPNYLPNYSNFKLKAIKVTDPDDPDSMDESQTIKVNSYNGTSAVPGEKYSTAYNYVYVFRFMTDNFMDIKNENDDFGDGDELYFTIKSLTSYYAEAPKWNGTAMLPPLQIAPYIKKLDLINKNTAAEPFFERIDGEFDFSNFDISKIYKTPGVSTFNPGGKEKVIFNKYSEKDAKALKLFYIILSYKSVQGTQNSSSISKKSSFDLTGFRTNTPYLNAKLSIQASGGRYAMPYEPGYLRMASDGTYYIEPTDEITLPSIAITYSEE